MVWCEGCHCLVSIPFIYTIMKGGGGGLGSISNTVTTTEVVRPWAEV